MAVFSFLFILLTIPQLFADVSIAEKQTAAVKKFANKLSTTFDLTYNTDNKTLDQKDKTSNLDFTLTPAYPLSRADKLLLVISGNKDLKDERKFTYADSYLGYSKTLYKNSDSLISLSGITRIYHPTSEESSNLKTLRTKLFFAPQLMVDFAKRSTMPLALTYRPYYQQSFHKYKTAFDGQSNVQYSLSQRLIFDFTLGELFGITLDNIYGRSFTYQGNSKDNFLFDQSFSYSANKDIQFSVGHNNSGNALRANGRDSNVELFNKNKSTFYLNTSIRI